MNRIEKTLEKGNLCSTIFLVHACNKDSYISKTVFIIKQEEAYSELR